MEDAPGGGGDVVWSAVALGKNGAVTQFRPGRGADLGVGYEALPPAPVKHHLRVAASST